MVYPPKYYLLFSCAALALFLPSLSRAETLEDAARAALLTHPAIEVAESAQGMATQDWKEQRSGYWPTLSASAMAGRTFSDNSTSRGLSVTRGEAYSYLWDASITARQMVFDGAETKNRVLSAQAKERQAHSDLFEAQNVLANAAVQAYLDLMRASLALQGLYGHEEKILDYISRIKSAVDEGTSDEAEYQKALDIGLLLGTMITDYQGQVRNAESSYLEIIGHLPDTAMVRPDLRVDLLPETLEGALVYAQENNAGVKSALYSSQSAQYDIDVERAGYFPDINGELSYLKSEKRDVIGGEVRDAKAVMRMSWDFETGGAQKARVAKKRKAHKESLSRIHEYERALERKVRMAYTEYETAVKQFESQKKREKLNENLLETYGIQFEGARLTLLQLMQADNQFFTTKIERLNAEYRVLNAYFGILANVGLLPESLNLAMADGQQ